jgi:type III secretion protein V
MKELVVPLGLLAVMGSMLLPVPPMALDFLLVGNLVVALILFVSSLYVSDSLKLSSLPALLLIATLFRLGLNVATTRAILSGGDAGRVVQAFGEIVIAGNLVVGVAVFLLLTLIQFIVIAKGAERVAEVAARFTLDALPGKQMSVDADVRAGLIDFETARTRRTELQTESRFYGALDGAMKFVKGDAIAGLCMVAVNIIGGLAVGCFMLDLDVAHAVRHFTLLTIGDGLISQIPALLNALSAGMVVTRVSRGDNQSLAQEVLSQLGQIRSVKVIIGVLVTFLGLMPGMPALPFLSLGLLLFVAALLPKARTVSDKIGEPAAFEPRVPAVLLIEVGGEVRRQLHGYTGLAQSIQEFRRTIHRTHGLVLALPEFEASTEENAGYTVKLRGIPVTHGKAEAEAPKTLAAIIASLTKVVEGRMVEVIDDILTRRTLDSLEREAPELVAAVVPGVATVTQITELLRVLAREGVPIRNFDSIIQAIAENGTKVSTERILLEEVRIALRRVISHRFANASGKIPSLILDPVLDVALAQTERDNKPLDIEVIEDIVGQLSKVQVDGAVVLVSKAARRLLSECLAIRQIRVPVLALDEIAEGYEIEVRGQVNALTEEAKESVMERLAA